MDNRSLQNPVKAERLVRLLVHAFRESIHLSVEKLVERFPEPIDITAAIDDGSTGILVLQQGIKQMLQRDVFVPAPFSFFQCDIESAL